MYCFYKTLLYRVPASQKADWQSAFRDKSMRMSYPLRNWVIIYQEPIARLANELLGNLQKSARGMHFEIGRPHLYAFFFF